MSPRLSTRGTRTRIPRQRRAASASREPLAAKAEVGCDKFPRSDQRQSLSRDDPSAFAAPAQFGPFRVLHQIGVGALGPVFRTYEPERDRLVAVKAFRLDITPGTGAEPRRRAVAVGRGGPVPSVDRRADRGRRGGHARLQRRRVRGRRVARRRDAALRTGADHDGAAVHHTAGWRHRLRSRRRRRARRVTSARHFRHPRRSPGHRFRCRRSAGTRRRAGAGPPPLHGPRADRRQLLGNRRGRVLAGGDHLTSC